MHCQMDMAVNCRRYSEFTLNSLSLAYYRCLLRINLVARLAGPTAVASRAVTSRIEGPPDQLSALAPDEPPVMSCHVWTRALPCTLLIYGSIGTVVWLLFFR